MKIATPVKVKYDLIDSFKDIVEVKNQDLLQENANVDGRTPMGQIGKFASESSKYYTKQYLLNPLVRKAIVDNYIHPHDLDFYARSEERRVGIDCNDDWDAMCW